MRPVQWATIFCVILIGCCREPGTYTKKDIVKITDFELSPDEEKIAFSAITPTGNLDIWVIDIDGKNLKKLTFQDRSSVNHIAKFFKKRRWRNFFEIDMLYPKWTNAGKVAFCQQLSKTDIWSVRTVSKRYLTINPNGTGQRPKQDSDKIINRKQPTPVNKFKFSDWSKRYKIKILLENDDLWVLRNGATNPEKLIQ